MTKIKSEAPSHALPVRLSVSELGRMLGDAYRRYDAMQGMSAAENEQGSGLMSACYQRIADDFEDMEHGLRELLSAVPAQSDSDAIVQLAWATSLLDMLEDMWPEDAETYDSKRMWRQLQRIVHSVLDHVQTASGLRAVDLIGPNWDNENLNPWRRIERAERGAK